jgi:hypothetical protein
VTGRDLVSAALRKNGVLASGETLAAGEATDGVAEANRMLGTWANEGILIPAIIREEFALTAGDQEYTMGASGADFSTARPAQVVRAKIEDQSTSPPIESRLEILGAERWAEEPNKEIGNSIPRRVYIDAGFPNRTLTFWPKPQANLKTVLYSEKQLSAITLSGEISVAPGIEDALVLNLSVRLSPEYGRPVDPLLLKDAVAAKDGIARASHRESLLKVDDALVPRMGSTADIFSGGLT